LIEALTKEGDLVVDPCAGRFGILKICQETKRNFWGTDLNYSGIKKFMQQAKKKAKSKSCWGEKIK